MVDPTKFVFQFEPAGLQFNPGNPARPKIEFRSTKTEVTGDTALRVHGDLTVRGITKPVALDVQYLGLFPDPKLAEERMKNLLSLYGVTQ